MRDSFNFKKFSRSDFARRYLLNTAKYSAYSFELFPDRFDFIPAFGVYNMGQKAWFQVRRQLDITLFGQYCMIRGKTVPQFNDSSLLPFSE